MERCCHVLVCALYKLDKLVKRVFTTVGPSLTASFEPLTDLPNGSSLKLLRLWVKGKHPVCREF